MLTKEKRKREMKGYRAGSELFYHESDAIYKVKVLEANCDKSSERYNLMIIGVVRTSKIFGSRTIGDKFSCEKIRGSCKSGLWQLLDRESFR